jgi:hypothetical protein
MRKSMAAEAAKELAVDLRQEATAAVSQVHGKRTKVVTTETILAIKDKPTGARARKSSRLKGAAASSTSMDKAKRLAAERNLDTIAGKEDFLVLDLYSDARLSSVITDSCVVFVSSAGSPSEALSVLRAKEQVQAALAEVANRMEKEREARAAREASLSTSAVQGEAGVSLAADGSSRKMEQVSPPQSGAAAEQSMPREGVIGSRVPSPKLGRPRGTRVTCSVTRSMLAMRKGKEERGLQDESPPL